VKFRKKPIIVEAIEYTGNAVSVYEMCRKWLHPFLDAHDYDGTTLTIYTLEGQYEASFGDWIIKGVKGEFYPCKPEIFSMTYEAVNEVDV
jgi:hypothetical protein